MQDSEFSKDAETELIALGRGLAFQIFTRAYPSGVFLGPPIVLCNLPVLVSGDTRNVVWRVDDLLGYLLILRTLFNDMMVVIAEAPPPRFLGCVNELIQATRRILGSDNIIKLIPDPIRLRQCVGYLDESPGIVMRKSFTNLVGRPLAPLRDFALASRPFGRQLEPLSRSCA